MIFLPTSLFGTEQGRKELKENLVEHVQNNQYNMSKKGFLLVKEWEMLSKWKEYYKQLFRVPRHFLPCNME